MLERLRAVVQAVETYALSNDPGDDVLVALDALQPGDLGETP